MKISNTPIHPYIWQKPIKLKSLKPGGALRLLDCIEMAIGLVAIVILFGALGVMVFAF